MSRILSRHRANHRLLLPLALIAIAVAMGVAATWLVSSARTSTTEAEALRVADVVARQTLETYQATTAVADEPHPPLPADSRHHYSVRTISAWNLSPRNGLADDFERWGWAELRAQDAPEPSRPIDWQPAWRIEHEGPVRTLRYLVAAPATGPTCIGCHTQLEQRDEVRAMRSAMGQGAMPERAVNQLLGAIEVAVPLEGGAADLGAAWRRLGWQLATVIGTGLLLAAALVFAALRSGERERARLHYWTLHDRITGLPNRGVFVHRLETLAQRARDDRGEFALVCVDLDQFKNVNDTLGHAYGDKVLRKLAERLTDSLQPADQAFRLSGDQFAVILREPGDLRELQKRVQKLLSRLTAPMHNGDQPTQISASVGVSRFPHDAQTADLLMRATDQAMYSIKESGRSNVSFYQAQLESQANLGHALRDGLREAAKRGQFELYYQPIVQVSSRRVISVEALLRWRHPVHGLVPPNLFLAVAEDIGMLRQVDDWVIREAASQRARWTAAGLPAFRVGINLSPQRYLEPGLLSQIDRVLAEVGVRPDALALEVTEGALARSTERVAETLTRCHRRGIQIVLDDFGTGYSSMSLLKLFPIDVLKIDKSFVDGLPDDRSDCTLTSAIIGLSQSLGIAVVAEGVETLAQFDHLLTLGCENMQGFLIARPLPSSGLEALVRDELFNLPVRGGGSRAAKAEPPIGRLATPASGASGAAGTGEGAGPGGAEGRIDSRGLVDTRERADLRERAAIREGADLHERADLNQRADLQERADLRALAALAQAGPGSAAAAVVAANPAGGLPRHEPVEPERRGDGADAILPAGIEDRLAIPVTAADGFDDDALGPVGRMVSDLTAWLASTGMMAASASTGAGAGADRAEDDRLYDLGLDAVPDDTGAAAEADIGPFFDQRATGDAEPPVDTALVDAFMALLPPTDEAPSVPGAARRVDGELRAEIPGPAAIDRRTEIAGLADIDRHVDADTRLYADVDPEVDSDRRLDRHVDFDRRLDNDHCLDADPDADDEPVELSLDDAIELPPDDAIDSGADDPLGPNGIATISLSPDDVILLPSDDGLDPGRDARSATIARAGDRATT